MPSLRAGSQGPSALPVDEARVVDEEVHVGIALRHAPHVGARRVLVGARPEGEALVHGDVADAELARLLDQRDAGLVVQAEALAVGTPLRIGLPGADAVARGQLVHALEVAGLVGVHAAVDEEPVRAVEPFDDARGGRGLLDGERLALARGRHEGKHHQVGVGIEEDVLHELVLADALQVVEAAGALRRPAGLRLGHLQGPRRLRQPLGPRAGRVHEVALHVEDELVAVDRRARELLVEGGLARQVEIAAAGTGGRIGLVQGEERGGGAAPRRRGRSAGPSRGAGRHRLPPRGPAGWRGGASGASGTGANSPLLAASSFTGRRVPSGSRRVAMASSFGVAVAGNGGKAQT